MRRQIAVAFLHAVLAALPAVASAQVVYRLTDLGDLPNGEDKSHPVAINETGTVVGVGAGLPQEDSPTGVRGFIWKPSTGMQDFSRMAGFGFGIAIPADINDAGEVAGTILSQEEAVPRWNAFKWNVTGGTAIPDVDVFTFGRGIDGSGRVVGRIDTGGDQDIDDTDGFVWDTASGLSVLSDMAFREDDINDANSIGQFVGDQSFTSDCTARERECGFLWDPVAGRQVINAPDGDIAESTFATGVNNKGEVVGNANFALDDGTNETHGFLWTAGGGMRLLAVSLSFTSINDRGQIGAVRYGKKGNQTAMLFENGELFDLNDLIDQGEPLKEFVHLRSVQAINIRGVIAATGVDSRTGAEHAYVLNPIIPPYSVTPTSRSFGNQALNSKSIAQSFVVRNTGTTALPIVVIKLVGTSANQYSLAHNCDLSVPSGGSCRIDVWFTPTSTGSKAAKVSVSVGKPSLAKTASFSGTGVVSKFTNSPTSLSFGSRARGTTSAAKLIKITNIGTVIFPITSISLGGHAPSHFAQTNNCPAQLSVGSSCSVSVVFKPTAAGDWSARVIIRPAGGASPKSTALSGIGT